MPLPRFWFPLHRLLGRSRRPAAGRGLSLVEVLVASLVGGLMVTMATQLFLSNLRASVASLAAQELRDDWSQLTLFLNADISEACSAQTQGSTLVLRLMDPAAPSLQVTACQNATTITYTLADGVLSRSGPPVGRDGRLDFNADPVNAVPLLHGVAAFNLAGSEPLAPHYQITLQRVMPWGSTVQYTGQGAAVVGRTRVRSYD